MKLADLRPCQSPTTAGERIPGSITAPALPKAGRLGSVVSLSQQEGSNAGKSSRAAPHCIKSPSRTNLSIPKSDPIFPPGTRLEGEGRPTSLKSCMRIQNQAPKNTIATKSVTINEENNTSQESPLPIHTLNDIVAELKDIKSKSSSPRDGLERLDKLRKNIQKIIQERKPGHADLISAIKNNKELINRRIDQLDANFVNKGMEALKTAKT